MADNHIPIHKMGSTQNQVNCDLSGSFKLDMLYGGTEQISNSFVLFVEWKWHLIMNIFVVLSPILTFLEVNDILF